MRKVLLFNLVLMCCISVSAQINDDWNEVGNAAYNSEINSVAFTSEDLGFAVGTGGAYLKTTDGGQTWVAFDTGFDYLFNKIVFTNPLTGYIAGSKFGDAEGKVIKTTNGGVTWTEVLTDNMTFYDIFFVDNNTGFAVCYESVYKTTDQGQTWIKATVNGAYDIYNVFFATPQEGYIAANGGCFKSTDGGVVWTKIKEGTFGSVTVTTGNLCYLSSNSHSYLFKSVDGGSTWNQTTSTGIEYSSKALVIDGMNMYAWSIDENYDGKIAKTTDGGSTWTRVLDNLTCPVRGIMRKTAGSFIACGSGGLFMSSTNGNSWDIVQQGLFKGKLNDICFINNTTAFAVSEAGVIVKTTDQCSSWQVLNSGTTEKLWGICATSENTLYAVGNNNTLLKTTDGGLTWNSSNSGYTMGFAHQGEIAFVDDNTGYAVMTDVFKTTDAGATWTDLSVPFTSTGISIPNSDTIYVSAFFGVNRSVDGGASWTNVNPMSSIFWGIDFLDAKKGIAAFQNYKVFNTEDAGNTWTDHHFQGESFRDAHMVDENIFYAIGLKGLILKSTDAGTTWNEVQSGTNSNLYDITFTSDNTGYILGQDGKILRRANVLTYALTFNVLGPDGAPLLDATVTLNGSGYPAGQYVMQGLLPGNYDYIVSRQGFCPSTGSIQLTGNYQQNINLFGCFTVNFQVSNYFDEPVENASITITGIGNTTTNAAGFASIITTSFQNADFAVAATGYKTNSGSLSAFNDTVFLIQLEAALDAPVALAPSSISFNSFTAKWSNAPQTDSVFLYVSTDNFQSFIPGFDGALIVGTEVLINNLSPNNTYTYKLRATNSYGVSDFSNTISVTTLTSGIFSQKQVLKMLARPNPATETIQFMLPGIENCAIVVTDANGRNVISELYDSTNDQGPTLNIIKLANGLYHARIMDGKQIYVCTFIKN